LTNKVDDDDNDDDDDDDNDVAIPASDAVPQVTGQLADTPTRGLPTRGLDISRTGQLAD